MVRISKPVVPATIAFMIGVVFFETISFGILQALIPLLPVLNQGPTPPISDEKYITNIPITFAILEFCLIAVGALLGDIVFSRKLTGICTLVVWSPISIILYMTDSKTIYINLIRFMAIVKGIAQPIILSIGAQDYGPDDYYQMYMYFMFTYCAHVTGRLVVETILQMDLIEHNICGNMNCIDFSISISTAASFLGLVIYMLSLSHITKPNHQKTVEYRKEIKKVFGTIFVFIPYTVFWAFYQRVPPQLQKLPFLIDMQKFSATDMPKFITEITMVFALIYYIIFRLLVIFFLNYANILMTIGGILLGVWPIIASPMLNDQQDQIYQAGPVKPDAIQIIYNCNKQQQLDVDIPYYKSSGCSSAAHLQYRLVRDQILVLRENNLCPNIIFKSNTLKQCFKRGSSYFLFACKNGFGAAFVDYGKRDKNAGAVVCAMLQRGTKCEANKNPLFLRLCREPTAEHEAKNYEFSLYPGFFTGRESNFSPFAQSCQTVDPGTYQVTLEAIAVPKCMIFEAGAVYYLTTDIANFNVSYFMAVKPFKSKLLDTRLIGFCIVQGIGQFLLIVNGFYTFTVIIHPKFRTIAIAIWFMMIKFGAMMYEIQYNDDIYFQHGDLDKIGYNLICCAILSYIMQELCCTYTMNIR